MGFSNDFFEQHKIAIDKYEHYKFSIGCAVTFFNDDIKVFLENSESVVVKMSLDGGCNGYLYDVKIIIYIDSYGKKYEYSTCGSIERKGIVDCVVHVPEFNDSIKYQITKSNSQEHWIEYRRLMENFTIFFPK